MRTVYPSIVPQNTLILELQEHEILLLLVGVGIVLGGVVLSRFSVARPPCLVPLPIVIILAAAALLRLNRLDQPYTDYINWRQASTAMMADNYYHTNRNIFYPQVNWGGPGPNYQGREFQTLSYVAAMLYGLVGQHDWVGRAVAVG